MFTFVDWMKALSKWKLFLIMLTNLLILFWIRLLFSVSLDAVPFSLLVACVLDVAIVKIDSRETITSRWGNQERKCNKCSNNSSKWWLNSSKWWHKTSNLLSRPSSKWWYKTNNLFSSHSNRWWDNQCLYTASQSLGIVTKCHRPTNQIQIQTIDKKETSKIAQYFKRYSILRR